MSDHSDLIARIEAADGPSRELDAEIDCLLRDRTGFVWLGHYYDCDQLVTAGGSEVPAYTASIDAAVTLVPEGYVLGALRQRTRYEIAVAQETSSGPDEAAPWMSWVHIDTNDRTFRIGRKFSHHGHAATPALAICAAALRAKEGQ